MGDNALRAYRGVYLAQVMGSAVEPVPEVPEDTVLERWEEACGLAGQISRAAIQRLLDLLGDADPLVRWQAGVSLAQTAARLRRYASLGFSLWNRQAPELSFSGLLVLMRDSLLHDPNPSRRAAVADALALWAYEGVVGFLCHALQDPDPMVRVSVAEALGRIKDKMAVEALLAALADPSIWVRRAAIDALGSIADPQAVPALQQALDDVPAWLRANVMSALGHMSTAKSREILERYVQDPDAGVRWCVARSLGQVGNAGSLPALQQLADDNAVVFDRSIAEMARAAIEAIAWRERGLLSWARRVFYTVRQWLEKKRRL